MIKGILFDMDGTLVDSERYYTDGTYDWMSKMGYDGDKEAIYEIIGTTMDKTALIIKDLLNTDLTKEEILKINSDYFYYQNPIDYNKYIFEEVKDKLKELHNRGYLLALCSASSQYDIDNFLTSCDLKDVFNIVKSTEDLPYSKPDGRVYTTVLEMLGLLPNEVIVVEDSYSGILAGKNAKIMTIARKDYRFNIDQSKADAYIDSLNDLDKYLGDK